MLLVAAQLGMAQGGPGIAGNWLGTLEPGAVKLRLAVKVAKGADGSLSAKLDSLDQGANDLPVSSIVQTGTAVKFELQVVGGSFEGTLNGDGSEISGAWKQGAGTRPLVLRRTEKLPVASRPQEPTTPYPYIEDDISYANKPGHAKLAGTLTLPK